MSDTGQNYQGIKTLENLKEAVNYNSFIERELAVFIGSLKHALDFGAGNGEFAGRLKRRGIVVDCIEEDPLLSANLHKAGFKVNAPGQGYDRIYSLNVLEHIEDDSAALKDLYNMLNEGGKIFIYVPAFMVLYSAFDKKIGHYRRYRKNELVDKLKSTGFRIERAEYADSLGFFAWLVLKFTIRGSQEPNPVMIKIYDRLVFPLSRLSDLICKFFFGKNLLVIAAKA